MNLQLKIFDCSNSEERPPHRDNSFGPKENDIVSDLKKYANIFGATFVNSLEECNLIFTNDVFPKHLQKSPIPKIKRMDGVYWHTDFTYRNAWLNESALLADKVIFISRFSAKSLKKLYPAVYAKLNYPTVILNTADNSIFYPKWYKDNTEIRLTAIASSWTREEKRFNSIIELAENNHLKVNLIGDCPNIILPHNIKKFGYISNKQITAEILREETEIFVNLSYADACPKVVSQAMASGIPVLYADSGGLDEQVGSSGIGITDDIKEFGFASEVPKLDMSKLSCVLNYMVEKYQYFREEALSNNIPNHMLTLYKYFEAFRETVNRNK